YNEYGRKLTVYNVANMKENMNNTRQMGLYFRDFYLLLTPTTAMIPPRLGLYTPMNPSIGLLEYTKNNRGITPFVQLANYTGLPAISLPLGQTVTGFRSAFSSLPVSAMKIISSVWPLRWRKRNHGPDSFHPFMC